MLICQKQALRWILPLTIYIHRGMRASKLLVCSLESSGEGGGDYFNSLCLVVMLIHVHW